MKELKQLKQTYNRHLATLILAATLGVTAMAPAPAQAANAASGTGVGFILGEPSGFSLKLPQGPGNAWQFALGYDLDGRYNNGAHVFLGGDYLWYNYNLIRVQKGRLPLYYGPGAFASVSGDHSRVGIRGVVGLAYQFANAPFDIFFEVGPGISILPKTEAAGFGGLGGRFFF